MQNTNIWICALSHLVILCNTAGLLETVSNVMGMASGNCMGYDGYGKWEKAGQSISFVLVLSL